MHNSCPDLYLAISQLLYLTNDQKRTKTLSKLQQIILSTPSDPTVAGMYGSCAFCLLHLRYFLCARKSPKSWPDLIEVPERKADDIQTERGLCWIIPIFDVDYHPSKPTQQQLFLVIETCHVILRVPKVLLLMVVCIGLARK